MITYNTEAVQSLVYISFNYMIKKGDIQLTPKAPNVSVLLNLLPKMWILIQLTRYHMDFGLGIMLNGGGSVPPSSK